MRPAPQFEAGALWLSRLDPEHELSAADREKVLDAFTTIQSFRAGRAIWTEGQLQFSSFVLVEGMAASMRRTARGRSQMIAILVPGDLCDGEEPMEPPASVSVVALADCRVAFIPQSMLEELCLFSPKLRSSLRRVELEQRRTVQEWIVNLGRRPAATRLANLFCELLERLARVGLVRDLAYDLPLTQRDLADVSGLSAIHVNRILQQFRRAGLLSFSGGVLQVLDFPRLSALGEFRPGSYFQSELVADPLRRRPPEPVPAGRVEPPDRPAAQRPSPARKPHARTRFRRPSTRS